MVIPMRWIVERSNAWVERCKSLVKNFDRTLANANARLKLCFIRLMLKRLATFLRSQMGSIEVPLSYFCTILAKRNKHIRNSVNITPHIVFICFFILRLSVCMELIFPSRRAMFSRELCME